MTKDELNEILLKSPDNAVADIESYYTDLGIPAWSDLEAEYDASLHSIMTDYVKYPQKMVDGVDEQQRISIAKQEEVVNKMAQSLFYNTVERKWDCDETDKAQVFARDLYETNYSVENNINSINFARSKELFKCCQVATMWTFKDIPIKIKGVESQVSLVSYNFSPALGYTLYPFYDSNQTLIGIGIYYEDTDDNLHLMMYVQGATYPYYNDGSGWTCEPVKNTLSFIPVTFMYTLQPIWGGSGTTALVDAMESLLSKNQMYINKNAVPTFTIYKGKNGQVTGVEEESNDSRRIIQVGEGGEIKSVTWDGAKDAVQWQFDKLNEIFYQQVQVFNNSPSAMQKTPLSADNKEILLFDSKAKAKEVGGNFIVMFNQEWKITRELTAIQFPSITVGLNNLSVRSIINPYSVKSKADIMEYVTMAVQGGVMSTNTAVQLLGEADDIAQEVELIKSDNSYANTNL